MSSILNLKKSTALLAGTLLLAGCLATTPKDSDPITSLNPPQQDLVLYQQYGVNTVGDFKAVALEMKDTGYVTGGGSYKVMFDYLKDRETAKKTPGLTATQVKQQRIQAEKQRAEEKRAAQQRALNELFNAKWSIGDLSCDLGGGTYKEFGEQYRMGMRSFIRGRLNETDQRTDKQFTVNDDGSITLSYTIFAAGNRLMTQMLGSPNAVVSRTTTTYRIKGNTLYGAGTDSLINVEQVGRTRNPGFTTRKQESISTRC